MQQLVTMCTTPALIGLGIVPPPGQEEPALDLPLARHFIDLLALLDEKTSDQLDDAGPCPSREGTSEHDLTEAQRADSP